MVMQRFLRGFLARRHATKHLFFIDTQDMLILFCCGTMVQFICSWKSGTILSLVVRGAFLMGAFLLYVLGRVLKRHRHQDALVLVAFGSFLFYRVFISAVLGQGGHRFGNVYMSNHAASQGPGLQMCGVALSALAPSSGQGVPEACTVSYRTHWIVITMFLCTGLRLRVIVGIVGMAFLGLLISIALLGDWYNWAVDVPLFLYYAAAGLLYYYAFFCIGVEICRIRYRPLRVLRDLPPHFFCRLEPQALESLPPSVLNKSLAREEHLYILLRITQVPSFRDAALQLIGENAEFEAALGDKEKLERAFLRSALIQFHLKDCPNRSLRCLAAGHSIAAVPLGNAATPVGATSAPSFGSPTTVPSFGSPTTAAGPRGGLAGSRRTGSAIEMIGAAGKVPYHYVSARAATLGGVTQVNTVAGGGGRSTTATPLIISAAAPPPLVSGPGGAGGRGLRTCPSSHSVASSSVAQSCISSPRDGEGPLDTRSGRLGGHRAPPRLRTHGTQNRRDAIDESSEVADRSSTIRKLLTTKRRARDPQRSLFCNAASSPHKRVGRSKGGTSVDLLGENLGDAAERAPLEALATKITTTGGTAACGGAASIVLPRRGRVKSHAEGSVAAPTQYDNSEGEREGSAAVDLKGLKARTASSSSYYHARSVDSTGSLYGKVGGRSHGWDYNRDGPRFSAVPASTVASNNTITVGSVTFPRLDVHVCGTDATQRAPAVRSHWGGASELQFRMKTSEGLLNSPRAPMAMGVRNPDERVADPSHMTQDNGTKSFAPRHRRLRTLFRRRTLWSRVDRHAVLHSGEVLNRTVNAMWDPVSVRLAETGGRLLQNRVIQACCPFMGHFLCWLQGVHAVMTKAQWRHTVHTPKRGGWGRFLDTKIERWFLAWVSPVQARQHILLNPFVTLLTCLTVLMTWGLFFADAVAVWRNSDNIGPEYTPQLTSLLAYLVSRSACHLLTSVGMMALQKDSYYNGSFNSHYYKRRASVSAIMGLFLSLLDTLMHQLLIPGRPPTLQFATMATITFPLFTQLTTVTQACVGGVMIVGIFCLAPIFIRGLDAVVAALEALLAISVFIAIWLVFMSRCIVVNYRLLFCRYVLPYLLYLDALQPPHANEMEGYSDEDDEDEDEDGEDDRVLDDDSMTSRMDDESLPDTQTSEASGIPGGGRFDATNSPHALYATMEIQKLSGCLDQAPASTSVENAPVDCSTAKDTLTTSPVEGGWAPYRCLTNGFLSPPPDASQKRNSTPQVSPVTPDSLVIAPVHMPQFSGAEWATKKPVFSPGVAVKSPLRESVENSTVPLTVYNCQPLAQPKQPIGTSFSSRPLFPVVTEPAPLLFSSVSSFCGGPHYSTRLPSSFRSCEKACRLPGTGHPWFENSPAIMEPSIRPSEFFVCSLPC